MGYECLLAGLPALQAGDAAPITMAALLEQLEEHLSERDQQLLDLLRLSPNDDSITELLDRYDDSVLDQPSWWEDVREVLSEEDLRMQLVFERGLKSKNAFLRAWFGYNLDLNNVLVATICRKHGMDVSKAIVGDNEVAKILRKNLPQKDFGLSGLMDDYQDIMALVDEENLMEREKKTDALRFAWLEENTRFFVFSVENVLCYYLEAEMLNRWSVLMVEQGEQVFRNIVADMKKGADALLTA